MHFGTIKSKLCSFTMPPTTAGDATGSSGYPPLGQSSNPKTLLWAYQLARENKALTDSLLDVKNQLQDTEEFAKALKKCLDDILDAVHSFAHIFDSETKTDDDKHQLLLLRRQLQQKLNPLCIYGKMLVFKNKKMVKAIAAFEGLDELARDMSADLEAATSGPATPCPNPKAKGTEPFANAAASPSPTTNTARLTTSEPKDKTAAPKESESGDVIDAFLAKMMQQQHRPLETYFDEVNAYRRVHKPLTPNLERSFVKAFIAGCDDKMYRRRLTHSLRKKEFTWPWLTHEVQFLVLEEQYMERQDFALEHLDEDGFVRWPDGSTRTRFVPLPPVTEDDLTPSDGE